MIYIVGREKKFQILEKILKQKGMEYEYLELNEKEFFYLINSKEYNGIFVSEKYQDYLEKKSDYIYIQDDKIMYKDLMYLAFSKFLDNNQIDLTKKRVLILGSNKNARTVYKVIKNKFENVNVFIATISEELMDLEAGDRRIKKVEIKNLKQSEYIINTTTLGNFGQENSCMLDDVNLIRSNNIIDLIYEPSNTALLLKYKLKKAKIYSGLEIEKLKYELALEF